jgi:hypothetical protein
MSTSATTFATIAADIVSRVQKTLGRHMWERLSPEGRLVEVRAVLCCDMLRSMVPADHNLMIEVHRTLITTILPE